MTHALAAPDVFKKYKNKYIDVHRVYDYQKGLYLYEVRKAYKQIHENTCFCDSPNFYDNY